MMVQCYVHLDIISKEFEVQSGIRQNFVLTSTPFPLIIGDVLPGALPEKRGWVEWTMLSYKDDSRLLLIESWAVAIGFPICINL